MKTVLLSCSTWLKALVDDDDDDDDGDDDDNNDDHDYDSDTQESTGLL
jgi:hypothetical protein